MEKELNSKVSAYIKNQKVWKEQFEAFRSILVELELEEDFKWRNPCYTNNNSNIVLIQGFKEYCALLFPKGVLIEDTHGIMIAQTENVQSARQLRFKSVEEILTQKAFIIEYVEKAIQIEKLGLKVEKKQRENEVCDELLDKFDTDPEFREAFESLTPGRRNAYLFFFNQAKQSKTKTARIEKNYDKILKGKGLND